MNEHLRRAIEALEAGARDVRQMSGQSASQMRARVEKTVDEVLTHLEEDTTEPEPEDMMGSFDRQAKEIAEDLRRIDRLMRQRTGQE